MVEPQTRGSLLRNQRPAAAGGAAPPEPRRRKIPPHEAAKWGETIRNRSWKGARKAPRINIIAWKRGERRARLKAQQPEPSVPNKHPFHSIRPETQPGSAWWRGFKYTSHLKMMKYGQNWNHKHNNYNFIILKLQKKSAFRLKLILFWRLILKCQVLLTENCKLETEKCTCCLFLLPSLS